MENIESQEFRLIPVPVQQQQWFKKRVAHISDDRYPTDGAEWFRLVNCTIGINDRFDYDGNSNSLSAGFLLAYTATGKSTENTMFFLRAIECAIPVAIELEYFEIAANLQKLFDRITKSIIASEEDNIGKNPFWFSLNP